MNNKNQTVSDVDARKKVLGIDSVLTTDYRGWQYDFLRNSFYLPVQILKDPAFAVNPIVVITGAAFKREYEFTATCEGANCDMLVSAKSVGISTREIIATGERIIIAKIWYGRI